MKEAIKFLLIIGLFAVVAFLPGCTYTIVHEWDGEVPLVIEYPPTGSITIGTNNITLN